MGEHESGRKIWCFFLLLSFSGQSLGAEYIHTPNATKWLTGLVFSIQQISQYSFYEFVFKWCDLCVTIVTDADIDISHLAI